MTVKRKIEIFSAGCPACEAVISKINDMACSSCEVVVLDMMDAAVAQRARNLGVGSVPAILVDAKLANCCFERGPDETVLRAAGLGKPLV